MKLQQRSYQNQILGLKMFKGLVQRLANIFKKIYSSVGALEEIPLNLGLLPHLTEFSTEGCKHLNQVMNSNGGLNSLSNLSRIRPIFKLYQKKFLTCTSFENLCSEAATERSLYVIQEINKQTMQTNPAQARDTGP
ncbi:hypothetical protein YC2023_053719 [Brassica napus]